MVLDLRNSGIDIIGEVPWGTHFCQFFESGEDLLDILVPYFRAGLANNEFCMWVTAEPVGVEDAGRAMRKAEPGFQRYLDSGQLEIIPYSEWYTRDGGFDSERVLNGWVEKLDSAQARGYDGLRLTGNTFWLEKKDWQSFTDYERVVDDVISRYHMVALCTYQVHKCGVSEVADVISNHRFALVKRRGKWEMIESAERKRTEGQIRKLSQAVEQSPSSIVITDTDGNIEYVNPKFVRVTGYTQEEAIGKNPRILKSGETPPEGYERLWKTITTGGEWLGEFHNKKKTGELYWELAHISPIRNAQGVITHFVAVKEDITARKEADEKLRELNEDLEHRAAELDAVNRELEAFAYSVSHDLRAPLRTIDGFSKVLLEAYGDKIDDEGASYLRFVCEGSQRMARLIDDLLRLSRVTRSEMHREWVGLSDLASSIAGELQKAEPGRQVEFRIAPALAAHGDPQLLRLVLENLLHNAWKFTSKRPRARIELGATEQGGKVAYFVRDDGAGFDMAYANKLFGAFQRLHGEKEFSGTGIGLATVQRIINRHGGLIWAEGEVEKGATFYFTL